MASLSIALALLLASCCAELSDLDMAEAVHRRMSSYADGGSDAACWRKQLMVSCEDELPGVALTVGWNASGEDLIRDVPFSAECVRIDVL